MHISGITIVVYAQTQDIGKPNDLKVFGIYTLNRYISEYKK